MLIIKKLSRMIKEEISDAEMNMLHEQVARLINEYRQKKGEPPAGMQAIYDYVHEEQIDAVREVKSLLSIYKG